MRTLAAVLLTALLAASVLSGCSDDESSGAPAQDETTTRVDLTDQGTFEPDGLFTVAPELAELDGDELGITVQVSAVDVPLTIGTKRAVYAAGADLLKASEAPETTIEPGEAAEVVLTFAGATDVALDGQVTFEVSVGGARATSVGFSLVAIP